MWTDLGGLKFCVDLKNRLSRNIALHVSKGSGFVYKLMQALMNIRTYAMLHYLE